MNLMLLFLYPCVSKAHISFLYSTQILLEHNIPLKNVRICYSPFSRTTHTAKVVASVIDLPFEGPQCKVKHSILCDYDVLLGISLVVWGIGLERSLLRWVMLCWKCMFNALILLTIISMPSEQLLWKFMSFIPKAAEAFVLVQNINMTAKNEKAVATKMEKREELLAFTLYFKPLFSTFHFANHVKTAWAKLLLK